MQIFKIEVKYITFLYIFAIQMSISNDTGDKNQELPLL